jgi:hypothetical protein
MDEDTGLKTINLEEVRLKKNKFLKKSTKLKEPLIILSIVIILILISTYYVYSYPSSLVILDVNTSITLKVNKWNRVIDVSSISTEGNNILNNEYIKNKNINDTLITILNKAEASNYINPLDKNNLKHKVTVYISGDTIDITRFTNEIKSKKLNLLVNENGTEKFNNNSFN